MIRNYGRVYGSSTSVSATRRRKITMIPVIHFQMSSTIGRCILLRYLLSISGHLLVHVVFALGLFLLHYPSRSFPASFHPKTLACTSSPSYSKDLTPNLSSRGPRPSDFYPQLDKEASSHHKRRLDNHTHLLSQQHTEETLPISHKVFRSKQHHSRAVKGHFSLRITVWRTHLPKVITTGHANLIGPPTADYQYLLVHDPQITGMLQLVFLRDERNVGDLLGIVPVVQKAFQ
jgi:hypothetical protein